MEVTSKEIDDKTDDVGEVDEVLYSDDDDIKDEDREKRLSEEDGKKEKDSDSESSSSSSDSEDSDDDNDDDDKKTSRKDSHEEGKDSEKAVSIFLEFIKIQIGLVARKLNCTEFVTN